MILLSAVLLGMTSLVWKWTDKGRKRDRLLSDRLETLETKVKMFETEIAELKGMPRQVSSTGGASTSASGQPMELVVGFRPALGGSLAASASAPVLQQPTSVPSKVEPVAPPKVEPAIQAPAPPAPAPAIPAPPPPVNAPPPPPAPSIPLPPVVAKPAPHIDLSDFEPKPAAAIAANSEMQPFNSSHHYLHNIVIQPQDQLPYKPTGSDWCHECYHWWGRFADEDDSVPPARLELIRKTIGQLIRNQNGMKQGNVPKKAVVIKPPGVQLCNRLRNLMAGVILAMLTDRAVQYSFKRGYYADFEALFDSPLDLNPFPPEGGGKVVSGAGGYQASLCDDLAAGSDAASPILNIEHHTWIAPLLYLNPHLGPVMEAKTGGLSGIYKAIFMNLFMPSLNVRQRIEGFFKEHSLYDRPLLAMHLRSGPDFRPAMNGEEWARYGQCAQYITERLATRAGGGEGRKKAAWFIAADLEESRTRAQQEFAKYNGVYPPLLFCYIGVSRATDRAYNGGARY